MSDSASAIFTMGVTGDPITNGVMAYFSGSFGGADNQTSMDVVAPISSAEMILKYFPGLTGAALQYEDTMTGSRLVYMAFGFEGISGPFLHTKN